MRTSLTASALAFLLASSASAAECTVAGATVTRNGSVWSIDDLSEDYGRRTFVEAFAPCASKTTWTRYVAWRTARTRTRTTAWTTLALAPAWPISIPLGAVALVEGTVGLPAQRRTFQESLGADLSATEPPLPPNQARITQDVEVLDQGRTERQWKVPLISGGVLIGSAVLGVALIYGGDWSPGGLGP